MGYNDLDTRSQQMKHVAFAGVLPITDVYTDLSVIYGIFADYTADSGAHWFGYCSIAALAVPTGARLVMVLFSAVSGDGEEAYCPGGSAALGALLNLSQLHPVYNVWYDIVKVGKKGEGSGYAMMFELGGESCFQTLIHMAFLLSPFKWRQWHAGSGMDTGSIVIFASLAVSLASIANGALNVCMSGGDGAAIPGVSELFASSWVRKVIFRLYFLCGALLSLGAYAAFWASFGAWTWAVLLPAMVLVRPLAAHACGIINEDLGDTMLWSLLFGPLWLFVDYPVSLVNMRKEGKTALGVLLCGVLSAAEAWLMIALCVGVPSSNLRDTALYYPNTAAAASITNATNASITNATDGGAGADGVVAPLDTLLANGVLWFAAVLTVLKVLFGFVVVRHWKYPGLASLLCCRPETLPHASPPLPTSPSL